MSLADKKIWTEIEEKSAASYETYKTHDYSLEFDKDSFKNSDAFADANFSYDLATIAHQMVDAVKEVWKTGDDEKEAIEETVKGLVFSYGEGFSFSINDGKVNIQTDLKKTQIKYELVGWLNENL